MERRFFLVALVVLCVFGLCLLSAVCLGGVARLFIRDEPHPEPVAPGREPTYPATIDQQSAGLILPALWEPG